jgi:predicted MFS family arabinose efflux permease
LKSRSEKKLVILSFVAMFSVATLIAQHIAGKATRDALFLTYFPVERLPLMMMASAAASVVVVLLVSRLLARFGPARLVPVIFAISAALLLAQWRLIDSMPQVAAALLYLQISAVNSVLISGFWSVINERFDPNSAKRVIARLTAAATFGGLAGGVAVKLVSAAADTHSVLLMLCLMHVVCGVAITWIGRGSAPVAGESPGEISLLSPLRSSRLIRGMALLALLVATAAALMDYVLKAEAAAALDEEQLISFFSYFYVGVGLGSFILQSAVGNRALKWLGLGGTMIVWPLAILATGTLTLVLRSLVTAVLMRGSANLIYNSFFRTGFEVLYTPIPAEQKRTGKVMIDVGADRAGDMLGGLLVLGILLLPTFSESVLLIVTLAVAACCALLILLLQRNYSRQLADNLRAGQIDVEDIAVLDSTTSRTVAETQLAIDRDQLLREIESRRAERHGTAVVPPTEPHGVPLAGVSRDLLSDPVIETIAALRSDDAARIRRALTSRDMTPELIPHAIRLLREEDLLQDVLRALRPATGRSPGQFVDALLDPMQGARVRRRIPVLLGYSDSPLAVQGLLTALRDRDWDVRFRAAQGLDRIRRRSPGIFIRPKALNSALESEVKALRTAAAGPTPARRVELVFLLIGIGDNPATVELCWRALHGTDPWIKGTAVEYLENLLPAELWQELQPYLDLPSAEMRDARKADPAKELHAAAEKLKAVQPAARDDTPADD